MSLLYPNPRKSGAAWGPLLYPNPRKSGAAWGPLLARQAWGRDQ